MHSLAIQRSPPYALWRALEALPSLILHTQPHDALADSCLFGRCVCQGKRHRYTGPRQLESLVGYIIATLVRRWLQGPGVMCKRRQRGHEMDLGLQDLQV